MARLQQIIICEDTRGRGIENDPVRKIQQFWTTDGELLGEVDPCAPIQDPTDGKWIISDVMACKKA